VNKQLDYLIQLQHIDSQLLALSRMIDEFPRKVREAELPLLGAQKVLSSIKQQLADLEKRKRQKEQALEDLDEKIGKLKARTSDIKTNKEYQALLREIETVEGDRSSLEDDILAAMEDADTAEKRMKTEEQELKVASEEVASLKMSIDTEKAELEKELMILKKQRKDVVEAIDREVYDDYTTLLELYFGHAVSEVRGEICQGCNMNIPPQLFVEIKKNEDIFHCPQCRRILYYRESTS
jgi:predicted  nucleic acid-binding Zn-ribbon protein